MSYKTLMNRIYDGYLLSDDMVMREGWKHEKKMSVFLPGVTFKPNKEEEDERKCHHGRDASTETAISRQEDDHHDIIDCEGDEPISPRLPPSSRLPRRPALPSRPTIEVYNIVRASGGPDASMNVSDIMDAVKNGILYKDDMAALPGWSSYKTLMHIWPDLFLERQHSAFPPRPHPPLHPSNVNEDKKVTFDDGVCGKRQMRGILKQPPSDTVYVSKGNNAVINERPQGSGSSHGGGGLYDGKINDMLKMQRLEMLLSMEVDKEEDKYLSEMHARKKRRMRAYVNEGTMLD